MPRKAKTGPPPSSVVATGQPYGQAGEQQEVMRQTKETVAQQQARKPAPVDPIAAATAFQPPPMTPLGAPSQRPGEAVTAGLDIGAGPGSESLAFGASEPSTLDKLTAIYRAHPNPDLLELIIRAGGDRGL